jgi:uncharacterized membrane protein YcgQ (UPF0703/DUF1980 family)
MAHDHDHDHDHGHGHGHGHHHHHDDANTYYLEQVFNIAGCGALAMVMFLLWYTDALKTILIPKYHPLVLTGCILLFAILAIRAVAVWFSVAEPKVVPLHQHEHYFDGELCVNDPDCEHEHHHDHDHDHDHGHHHHHHDHSHDHGHAHDHDHGHEHGVTAGAPAGHSHGIAAEAAKTTPLPVVSHRHSHLHDHGHEHGWSPMRYVFLLIPVVLYFLLPPQGFSGTGNEVRAEDIGKFADVAAKGGEATEIGFLQLERAAMSEEARHYYEGRDVKLTGMFVGESDKFFTLTRYKMNCCAADALPLNAVIMVDEKSKEKLPYKQLRKKWVRVTGRVQFINRKGTDTFMPALVVHPTEKEPLDTLVQEIPPDPNPYAN